MFRKSWFLVCCFAVLAVFFSPESSAASDPRVEKIFQPTLEKLGLPTDLNDIPGGTIQVIFLASDETDVYCYSVIGCQARLHQFGRYIELMVPAGARFLEKQVTRIFFQASPQGEGWQIEFQNEVTCPDPYTKAIRTTTLIRQIPVQVTFQPKHSS